MSTTMSVFTILLDCDGVLANFNKRCLDRLNSEYGTSHTEESITIWDWIRDHPDIDKEHLRVLRDIWIKEKGFAEGMEVYPGAQDAVEALRAIGDVVCVTSPWHSDHWETERRRWLMKHFGFKSRDIYQSAGKERIWGDLIVDDKAANVVDWLQGIGQRRLRNSIHNHGLLWGLPHNAHDKIPPHDPDVRIKRVTSWQEVLNEAVVIYSMGAP